MIMIHSALHRLNICHRFLSPGAVLISGTGHCKISRLHEAKILPKSGKLNENVGVAEFKAPEVITSAISSNQSSKQPYYDERCDLFSFGCILFFLLTGESPIITDAITNQIS